VREREHVRHLAIGLVFDGRVRALGDDRVDLDRRIGAQDLECADAVDRTRRAGERDDDPPSRV